MTKNCVYSIPCSCGGVYKGETCRKAVCRREVEKLGMADHIWKEKGNHLLLRDQAKIIDKEEDVLKIGARVGLK